MTLKNYLKIACKKAYLPWEAVLTTVEQIKATLQPDRKNLILVYGGSFNPPHSAQRTHQYTEQVPQNMI